MRLKGKVCIITGSGKGMGRAAAILFAREGAKVIVATRSEDSGLETLNLIKKEGGEAKFFKVDVSKSQQVQDMIKFAVTSYGRLDVLINNAGVSGRIYGDSPDILKIPEDTWEKVMDVELKSIFLCCKYAIPEMIKAGGGSIVNCSTLSAIRGGFPAGPFNSKTPTAGPTVYAATKGGINAMNKILAVAYGRYKIRFNVVMPGYIETDLLRPSGFLDEENREAMTNAFPIQRYGTPEDIAYAYLFLASDESSYITGQDIAVDGGRTAY